MILASEEDVIDRMGLDSRVGVKSTANSGLKSATTSMENIIGTSFVREDRVDYFGCVKNRGSFSAPEYILNLTNSILDKNESVKVYVSSDGLPIVSLTGASANVNLVPASDYDINRDQGRVSLHSVSENYPYANVRKTIAVRYISGFDIGDGDLADQEQVPPALVDGAITLAIKAMRSSVAPKPKVNGLEYRQELSRMARASIASFIRTRLLGDFPASTELK